MKIFKNIKCKWKENSIKHRTKIFFTLLVTSFNFSLNDYAWIPRNHRLITCFAFRRKEESKTISISRWRNQNESAYNLIASSHWLPSAISPEKHLISCEKRLCIRERRYKHVVDHMLTGEKLRKRKLKLIAGERVLCSLRLTLRSKLIASGSVLFRHRDKVQQARCRLDKFPFHRFCLLNFKRNLLNLRKAPEP